MNEVWAVSRKGKESYPRNELYPKYKPCKVSCERRLRVKRIQSDYGSNLVV